MRPLRNKILMILFMLTTLILLTASGVYAEPEKEEEKEKPVEIKTIKYVFYIGLEGADNKDLSGAPNINSLASAGVKIPNTISVKPERFGVTVASLITGRNPITHGHINKWDKLKGENLFEIYQSTNRKVLFIDRTKDGLEDLGKLSKLYEGKLNNASTAVDRVVQLFPKEKPFLTTVFFSVNQADKNNTLKKIDQEIGRLFSFLHQQGIYENTLFVISGTKALDGFTILKGPGLKGGVSITNGRLIDIFPTVIHLTDGKTPDKLDGLVIWNALKPRDGYSEQNLLQKRVNEISLSQNELTRAIYDYKEEKRLAVEEMGSMEAEKEKIEAVIEEKDEEIKSLKLKIGVMKTFGAVMVILFGIGYLLEYFILRKRFLMF